VSYSVDYTERALRQMFALMGDDPDGLRQALDAVDALATDPRPAHSFPYGSEDLRRLRVGRYRALYEIAGQVITVGHISRTG